jgi:hypothetical protein
MTANYALQGMTRSGLPHRQRPESDIRPHTRTNSGEPTMPAAARPDPSWLQSCPRPPTGTTQPPSCCAATITVRPARRSRRRAQVLSTATACPLCLVRRPRSVPGKRVPPGIITSRQRPAAARLSAGRLSGQVTAGMSGREAQPGGVGPMQVPDHLPASAGTVSQSGDQVGEEAVVDDGDRLRGERSSLRMWLARWAMLTTRS